MKANLQDMRDKTSSVLDGLEKTLYAAARDVRLLKQTGCEDYADAVLDQNGFDGDTAEIYFHRFAPRGSSIPNNREEFKIAYQKWVQGIKRVQRVVQRYGGTVEVRDMPLDKYLAEIKDGKKPEHRVHVTILVPGQETLCLLRMIVTDFPLRDAT